MQNAKSSLKSGFTLIELSIVLVIIGLIIGGVLVGQDLIKAALARAQISQIEKLNTAVRTFQDKYGGLPGDLSLNLATQFGFQVSGCDGTVGNRDGNGMIDGYYSGSYIIEYGEATLFWSDLSQAHLMDATVSGSYISGSPPCGGFTANLTTTPGSNYIGAFFPPAKIGNGNFVYVYDGAHPVDSCCGGLNWFGVAAMTTVLANGGTVANPAITVMQAYNIDNKIDDGLPTSGNVRATYLNTWYVTQANPQLSDSATSCYNTTTNAYSIGINTGSGSNCALSFQLR